ncbi:VTT domain-containing protein [Paenibacillus sp. ACRRX]|uniref:TVP38/TMEM64 family protein n=1 Tax=Paenibacillus sp. UMB4589-SE434 TaxID=3046314 RepID=UPI0025509ABC|nr:VTT domain-containing protein [Paenibacillus sp. UMB4589-SE434]MCG7407280.1 VTT domain-containing protein [Paenibacillus sp. ACRRX]
MLHSLDINSTVDWLRSFGPWAIVVSLLMNVLISAAGFIPSVFLTGANVLVFGTGYGFIISLLGETIGAGITILLYRKGLSRLPFIHSDRWGWLQRLNQAPRRRQLAIIAVARLIPLMPSGLVNAVAALSSMRLADFVLVTFVGKAPSIYIETMVGEAFLTNDLLFKLCISVILLGLLYYGIKRINKRNGD